MQQASFKHFNLSHSLELRRVSFPAVESLELLQPVPHPWTAYPSNQRFNVPMFCTSYWRSVEQRKWRHAIDTTPPYRRKIRLIQLSPNPAHRANLKLSFPPERADPPSSHSLPACPELRRV